MKYQNINILLLSLVLLLGACQGNTKTETKQQPYLVVLSMDGFRWDYAGMYDTPNLDKLAQLGVRAERMIPSFPTKTFPNHYTLATGLYPDHHGIVLNGFYDPATDRYYSTGDREAVGDGTFYGGEPIWVTAEKQGVKAASLFWVGSEAEIKGVRPSIWKTYDHQMPFPPRVDTVISWLQLPEAQRPHLIMWYFHQPDSYGHRYGPESPQVAATVHNLDSLVGDFMNKLKNLPVAAQVNFVVVSDHGMGPISEDKVVLMKDYLQKDWLAELQGNNPVYVIKAADGHDEDVYGALQQIPHVQAWRSSEVPARLHYGSNPRTLDFTVVADSAWSLYWDSPGRYMGGTHGYDNADSDMHAIFYATGPAFRKNYVQQPFENVDLYPIMCRVLQIDPAPCDGSLNQVNGMLNPKIPVPSGQTSN